MAKFHGLLIEQHYDIIDGKTGHWRTEGISGADAMATDWQRGDEAWPAGEEKFDGKPKAIAR
jgi:hypothetical protein